MKLKVISTSVSKKGNKFMQVQVLEGEMPEKDYIFDVFNSIPYLPEEPKPFKDAHEKLTQSEDLL